MMWLSISDFSFKDFTDLSCLIPTNLDKFDYIIIIIGALIIFTVSLIQEKSGKSLRETLDKKSIALQWPLYLLLLAIIIIFGVYGPGTSPAEFVYMQF